MNASMIAVSGLSLYQPVVRTASQVASLKAMMDAAGGTDAQFDKMVAIAHGEAISDERNGFIFYLSRRVKAFINRGTE